MTMSNDDYLREVLLAQDVQQDSQEMKDLQGARAEVEQLLRTRFEGCGPTIRYGGSKAKGTMNLEDYDLDIIVYFPRAETAAGKTIKEIYENVQAALESQYDAVDPKTTALRVRSKERDLKIDVVPGRFVDETKSDAFVHQNGGSKEFLKTNLDKHIEHIRDSGFIEEIRLAKLWRPCTGIMVRTFPLELVVVKILRESAPNGLSARMKHLIQSIRDRIEKISIEDPANSSNDLSEALNPDVRRAMAAAARSTLQRVEHGGWNGIFDQVANDTKRQRDEAMRITVINSPPRPQPWRA